MAFYLLSRTIDAIKLISESPILESNSFGQKFMNEVLNIISYVIPDLYKFTQTEWLIYVDQFSLDQFSFLGQTIIYIVLLSSAALFDLYRKEL